MSPVTTHVLDTARGVPAQGLPVLLEVRSRQGRYRALARRLTDANGRVQDLMPAGPLPRGLYRLTFDTAAYFRRSRTPCFFPSVSVLFDIRDRKAHYHVPLLLSPFGYSTYRGT
jgi:5-hydroxyisourate hydrolase